MKSDKKGTHTVSNNVLWVFRNQWKYAGISLVLLLTMVPISVGSGFLGIYLPKTVVKDVTADIGSLRILLHVGIILGLLFLLNTLTKGVEIMNWAYFTRFRQSMQYELAMKTLTVPYETAESASFRDLVRRAQDNLWANGMHSPLTKISQSATEFMGNILGYLLFGTILSFLNPWITVILTLTPLVSYFFMNRYNRYEYENRGKWTPIDRKMWYIAGNSRSFDKAKDIRVYGLNRWFSETFDTLTKEKLAWNRRLLGKSFPINLSDLFIILIRDGAAYYILITMTLRGDITVDNFVLYFAAIGSFATWIGGIIEKWNDMHSLSLKVCDLRDVLEMHEAGREEGKIKCESLPVPCDIQINNLTFRYDGAEEDALKNINLHIRPGEKLAVVGLNGAGKTTLVKNICGLYSPAKGEIRISGQNADSFAIRDYYSLFSMVFQDFDVLCVTIGEIVSSRVKEELDEKRVEECLKMAGLWEKISALPDGINTPLNKQLYKNGVDLSGGEKQKLALAKAIYKDAPVLILDEPTAALDPIAENQMYLRYNELTREKTSVFISHRLSSTRFCDRIIYMENGRILEEGSHDELMKAGGKYAELFEIQSHYYKQ